MSRSRRAPTWRLELVAVALIGALTTGCYTITSIPPIEASRLDYRFGADRVIPDVRGDPQTIGERFTVEVVPRADLPAEWAKWAATTPPFQSPVAIELHGPMMFLQSEKDPGVVQLPLAYIQEVRVRELSPGKTAGLVVGVTLGTAAAVVLTALAIVLSTVSGIE